MVKHSFYELLGVVTRYTSIYLTQSHITIFDLEKVTHCKDEDKQQTPKKKKVYEQLWQCAPCITCVTEFNSGHITFCFRHTIKFVLTHIKWTISQCSISIVITKATKTT